MDTTESFRFVQNSELNIFVDITSRKELQSNMNKDRTILITFEAATPKINSIRLNGRFTGREIDSAFKAVAREYRRLVLTTMTVEEPKDDRADSAE